MTTAELLIISGVGGLFVGVFVNILILRGPSKRSFLPPWNRCAACDAPVSPAALLPVAGPWMMEGRCGGCGRRIAWWQPVVEVSNAALWMLAALHFGPTLELVPVCVFFSGILALSVIDLLTYRLPDRINLPLLLGSIPVLVVVSFLRGRPDDLLWAAVGGFVYWALLGIMWLIHPSGMGFGDVKFARVLGLYLGWMHPILVLYGIMFGAVGGSVAGIGMVVLTRGKTRGFPFGPWMAAGCVAAILLSARLTRNF